MTQPIEEREPAPDPDDAPRRPRRGRGQVVNDVERRLIASIDVKRRGPPASVVAGILANVRKPPKNRATAHPRPAPTDSPLWEVFRGRVATVAGRVGVVVDFVGATNQRGPIESADGALYFVITMRKRITRPQVYALLDALRADGLRVEWSGTVGADARLFLDGAT